MHSELIWLTAGRLSLALMLASCAVSDWRLRRISNASVVSGLVCALLWHTVAPHGSGLFDRYLPGALGWRESLSGALVALVVFALARAAGWLGAGDAKLMTAIGGYFGLSALPGLTLVVLSMGGVLALVYAAVGGGLQSLAREMGLIALRAVQRLSGMRVTFQPEAGASPVRLPYALAIGAGSGLYAWGQWSAVW